MILACVLLFTRPGYTDPIHDAVLANDLDQVKQLVDTGADVNALDQYGFSPLLLARIENHQDIAQFLSERDAKSQVNAVALQAQSRLWGLGYLADEPDGFLGDNTRQAISAFQRDQALPINGRITPPLMIKLDQLALARMQTMLKQINLYNGEIDGLRGPQTREAIQAAKTQFGIPEGAQILSAALFKQISEAANMPLVKPDTLPREDVPVTATVTAGQTNTAAQTTETISDILPISADFIRQAQFRLTWLGYDTQGADGQVGPNTMAAIKNFVQTAGLEEGENIDDQLMAAIDNTVIERVQTYLDALNYQPGPADGLIGDKTIAAITLFKQEQNLTADGELTDDFLIKLKQAIEASENADLSDAVLDENVIINVQQKLTWLGFDTRGIDGKLGSGTLGAIEAFANTVNIKDPSLKDDALIGALDNAVTTRVQEVLANLGYEPGPADGLLGGQTQQSIKAFEKKAGLAQTGQISGALLTKLQQSERQSPIKTDPEIIREVQAKLTTMGFDTKGIDGKLGGQTTNAIKSFQRYRKVSPTGEITNELLAQIDETLLNPPKKKATLTRDQVINMQRALNSLGYDVGVPDGKVGRKTQQALTAFLQAENLDPATEPNRLLLSMLLARAAPKIPDIRQSGGQTAPISSGGSGVSSGNRGVSSVGATEVSGRIRFHRSGGKLIGCSIAGVQVGAEWCRTFTHIKNTSNCKLSVRSNGQPLYIRCR